MSNVTPIESPRPSILMSIASDYGMDHQAFEATLRATVFPADGKREHLAAFLMVAKQFDLNPITKEIYAFPTKGGGIQPIVSIDGWINLMNSHPQMDGLEFEDIHDKKGDLSAIKCRVHRKDRTKPIEVVEYMAECRRQTEPWAKWPARMLRHKAAIQAARYAFGFAGIIEPDEWERHPENPANAREPILAPSATRIPPTINAEPELPKRIAEMTADEAGAELDKRIKERAAIDLDIPPALDRRRKVPQITPMEPESFLHFLDIALGEANDADELLETWYRICPDEVRDTLFPPDQEEAAGIYRKHERRLEP